MKRKNIVTVISFVLILMLVACGEEGNNSSTAAGENGSGDEKVIGISLQNFSDEFRTYMIDAMEEEELNHPDFEFIYSDAQNESATQVDQIENFISRGVDAIIFTPVDTIAAVDILERVNEANIPVIVSNQTFDGVEEATAYVGSESIESGIIQMEEVAKLLDGSGNIAIMDGEMGHEAQIKRTEGNKDIVEQNPDIEVILQSTASWSRSDGMELMENWLQSGEQIDALVANNDEMALGAIMALEAAGELDNMVVAGIDATPAALEAVKEGRLDITVFQDAIGQGKNSIIAGVDAANGKEVEDILVPYQLVTPENVDEYIALYE